MGGSSSQPRTDPAMSPINAFSIEDLYTSKFSEPLQENTGYWQEPYPHETMGEQVATSLTKKKKPTRNRQKRTIQTDDVPWQIAWTTEEEIVLAKGWVVVSENNKHGNVRKQDGFWYEVLEYMESKTKQESGAGDEDYVQRAMIHYQADTGLPFKFRHCWDVLKDSPKFKEISFSNFNIGSEGGSKRHKSSGSSSFNTESGDASIHLNTNVVDEEEVDGNRDDSSGDSKTLSMYKDQKVGDANNDINVLDNSPLFDDLLDDKAPVAPYVVNGVGFEKGYYLADGIHPQWATFVKSFTVANDAKHAYFKKRQESAQKDVERALRVLQ
uniref:Protein ALP1-like n=1 Tax=Tanacetum cinerariifolium TaxID=118510 RepID=A0A6L2MCP9_TANCI|nr:protein ALP1-like [Tanacetum cinerariifolium]